MSGIPISDENVNYARYMPEMTTGHYESWFLRANHPDEPRAFWIRYTVFCPKGKPENALGEIWAMVFDKTSGNHVAVKNEFLAKECRFSQDSFQVRIPGADLGPGKFTGKAEKNGNSLSWDISYSGDAPPLYLLPKPMYSMGFPKAKSLVPLPMALFSGTIHVNGVPLSLDNWVGSQNHNWGVKHTDHYAWGQVAGFDNDRDAFVELATARLKFGPVWTPFMTVLVLRTGNKAYALNSVVKSIQANGRFFYHGEKEIPESELFPENARDAGDFCLWQVETENKAIRIKGEILAGKKDFLGLTYYNPPGGNKFCLNSKVASARFRVLLKDEGEKEKELVSRSGAAFEILTDDPDHGITMHV